MKPIIQLDQPLINKIAAGEVVERPLSVVKELLENAIDAGASTITVEIAEGGLDSIRVTDNGVGIPADQILLAFARHATSKITSMEDLFEVGTLGFRGEALSSIASVAQVEMITKTTGAIMGTRVEIHGGKLVTQQDIGTADGTTVVVSNLFYNTPARRKFLKKPATEAGMIADCLQKLALGNPKLTIRYINNGNITFQTAGRGELKTTMLNVYGHEAAAKLVSVSASLDEMSLKGLIGKPEVARGNRQRQSFFINGRLIVSRLLIQAVEEATRTMLPGGKFPVYVLNLSIPHELVDVNVHPTKMDVRFADEDIVHRFIQGAVREALTESNLIPEVRFTQKNKSEPTLDQIQIETLPVTPLLVASPLEAPAQLPSQHKPLAPKTTPFVSPKPTPQITCETPLAVKEETLPTPQAAEPFFNNYRIIGLIFNTYWLISQNESLYLIDQHAAHERVLYEEIIEQTSLGQVQSQQLLTPIPLRLTPMETSLLRDNLPLFIRFGFEISDINEAVPSLTAVPYLIKGPTSTGFFSDILDKIGDTSFSRGSVYAHKTEAIAMAACKAAVKAGDSLSEAEARALITKMLTLENPFTCPHGRPTIIEITQKELERRFKRT
ncbi:MAG: DNA mismatch repair endonuclease MutL [Defluviitaleaceae bacterium]|nr:DNA mismatch repair endonuclease MutL [Defluviitaleaceae bacterium]